jgi:hypothetical protein
MEASDDDWEVCWYCHWGWPVPVVKIYDRALSDLNGHWEPLHYGPGHIVWEDENFDCAQWCLDHFKQHDTRFTDSELAIVRRSLEELAALPREAWDIVPADYDGRHPENYPPSVQTVHM